MNDCVACHQDPHAGRYKTAGDERTRAGCRTCHGAGSFRVTSVDASLHGRFGRPLEGAHGAIACPLCHEGMKSRGSSSTLLKSERLTPLRFDAPREKCVDCHDDPHRGQFGARAEDGCGACHGSDAFRPASRFAHDRDSRFALAGAHARVSCDKCHEVRRDDRGAYAVYRSLATECRACHAGAGVEAPTGAPEVSGGGRSGGDK
jgi:hypothetical protein